METSIKPINQIKARKYKPSEIVIGWLFMAPAVVFGLVFVIAPMVYSLALGFTDANLLKLNEISIVWFQNFARAFQDATLLTAFKNSMEFVIKVLPLQLLLALGLALILNSKIKGNTFFRWAFFCPVMLSLAVTSMLWMNLLNKDEGLINAILVDWFKMERQGFLTDPKQAMNVIVIMSAWQGAGYQMLIFLSGLQNIPKSYHEAASLDGANTIQRFWHITLPCIKPTFSFILVTTLIGAFRLITQPMIMTQGGPLDSTLTMSYYIYQQGITYRKVGYSSAIALLYTIFMAVISLTIRKLMSKGEDELA